MICLNIRTSIVQSHNNANDLFPQTDAERHCQLTGRQPYDINNNRIY